MRKPSSHHLSSGRITDRKSEHKPQQHTTWGPSREPPELAAIPRDGKQWRMVLNLLLIHYNHRHSNKQKSVSFKTQHERKRFYIWLFWFLRNNPVKRFKPDPRSLSGVHVDFVMKHLQEQALAGQLQPATLQTYFSFLKTYTGWIGKPGLLKPIHCYFDDPKLYQRFYVAKRDKTWDSAGVDAERVIDSITQEDRHAGAVARMLAAFGLRFKEGCCLRPHLDVVPAHRANLAEPSASEYLDTHRGTKGGRRRFIPIETDAQRQALAFAQSVARHASASLMDPLLDLKSGMRRVRYVFEKHGVCGRELRVTPHGLRHQYAARRFQELTGQEPPVRGGAPVAKEVDTQARLQIAEELGHGRVQITSAYCGSSSQRAGTTSLNRSAQDLAASETERDA